MISTEKPQTLTVGAASLKLRENASPLNAIEIQREFHKGTNSKKSYEEEIYQTITEGRKKFPGKNFYVVVLLKKERIMINVIRQYFFSRQSCPTPQYDQTVYQWYDKIEQLDYVWTIPDVATCRWLPLRKNELPEDQLILVSMIESFHNGDLDKLCAKLNGEKNALK